MGRVLLISLVLLAAHAQDLHLTPPKISEAEKNRQMEEYVLAAVLSRLPPAKATKGRSAQAIANTQQDLAVRISNAVVHWGRYFGIDPLLILGVMTVESHFVVQLRSKKGALGLMQIEPTSVAWLCKENRLKCPTSPSALQRIEVNVEYGVRLLADSLECQPPSDAGTTNLNWKIAAYNRGCKGLDQALERGTRGFTFSDQVLETYMQYRAGFIYEHPLAADPPIPAPHPFVYPNQGQEPAGGPAN